MDVGIWLWLSDLVQGLNGVFILLAIIFCIASIGLWVLHFSLKYETLKDYAKNVSRLIEYMKTYGNTSRSSQLTDGYIKESLGYLKSDMDNTFRGFAWLFTLLFTFFITSSITIPSRNTILMMGASEAVQTLSVTPQGQQITGITSDTLTLLDQYLKKQLENK